MKNTLKILASYAIVILIAFTVAVNYQLFVFPNRFAPAGLNGIFTMVQHVFGIKLSYTTIILNVPLAIISFFINSKPRALRSLTYSVSFSLFLMMFEHVDLSAFAYSTQNSTLLGPLVAGLITGFGGYIMHKMNACYGGTEFIAGFIHKYKPNVNFFNIIFVLNIVVALASYFVYDYKIEPVLLCIIYCFASSSVRDTLNRKHESAVRCEIITDHPEEMNRAIIEQLHHSATVISGKGAYTGKDKSILLCIVNPSQVLELTRLAAQFPESFVIVSSATKVLGNFKRLDSHGNPEVHLYDGGTAVKQ
jgi:uncharacterized membrane-anchored protein YitT (DUF2179 family)